MVGSIKSRAFFDAPSGFGAKSMKTEDNLSTNRDSA